MREGCVWVCGGKTDSLPSRPSSLVWFLPLNQSAVPFANGSHPKERARSSSEDSASFDS
jgi:hypothetical protein